MDDVEFNALNRGLQSIAEKKNPGPGIGTGTEASAIHGRLGAQVALLQSLILPTALKNYLRLIKLKKLKLPLTNHIPDLCDPCG
jgi:hypothetical protein